MGVVSDDVIVLWKWFLMMSSYCGSSFDDVIVYFAGFDRKELRGKLALAITANFVNHYTRDEAAVDEISGVAFIFNQKFFKVLTPHSLTLLPFLPSSLVPFLLP